MKTKIDHTRELEHETLDTGFKYISWIQYIDYLFIYSQSKTLDSSEGRLLR